jgi:hypothetical protein
MRDWLSSLTSDRVPEIAIALALGYALVTLAEHIVRVPMAVLAQNFGRGVEDDDTEIQGLLDLFTAPYLLNFSIGDTYVAYGPVVASALVLGLVALVAWFVIRRRNRELGECPFCASRIPYESTHCAYCGSGVEPGEPGHA